MKILTLALFAPLVLCWQPASAPQGTSSAEAGVAPATPQSEQVGLRQAALDEPLVIDGGLIADFGYFVGPRSFVFAQRGIFGPGHETGGVYSFVAGSGNAARGRLSTIGGGELHVVEGDFGAVGGGVANDVLAPFAVIAGGSGNEASGPNSAIAGGVNNKAAGDGSFIGSGFDNQATGMLSVVAGGPVNKAIGHNSTVGGGGNNIASGNSATIAGGNGSIAAGPGSAVGGGSNYAYGDHSAIMGGFFNTVDEAFGAIGGGFGNWVAGTGATIPGGDGNWALGDRSFAAGTRARAQHTGSFVWSDGSSSGQISSEAEHQFLAQASGGVTFYTDAGGTTGAVLAAGSGSWAALSDRAAKENFGPVDGDELLERLSRLPIQEWNYRAQGEGVRHLGPTAQDFRAAFGLGEGATTISQVDADGVALAAIQSLTERVARQERTIRELSRRLEFLESGESEPESAAETR